MGEQQPKEQPKVFYDLQQDIAILRIANPPVNAGSQAVRQGIVDGLKAAAKDGVKAAVLIGAGKCFVAGSDMREFSKPLLAPELPDVIRTIEGADFPVIAAIHGVALGGGLELALGCDHRIAVPDARLGLPEVSLGMIPGAGGTQRLPRLTGVSRAIEMICSAKPVSGSTARDIGLVDQVVEEELLQAAIRYAKTREGTKRLAIDLTPPEEPETDIQKAIDQAIRRGNGRPNILEAVGLIKASASGNPGQRLADERAVFQKLRVDKDATALRYLFFAEKRAASINGSEKSSARQIENAGVVGGGTMGQGIARALIMAGINVTIVEQNDAALQQTLDSIRTHYDLRVSRGRMTSAVAGACQSRLRGETDIGMLSACDLVIEAVFEDMGVKQDVLQRVEAVLADDAIIATNTSYLDINEMASPLRNPERVIGLHFFNPADVMKLLEIIRTGASSDQAIATALAIARKLKKQPVIAEVSDGFIGNRLYAAYRRRAELLVLDGASPQQVDQAATEFGFAMGPFKVADWSGLDIAWAMRKRQAPTRDPLARYVTIPDSLCEAGRLGQKTGKGWYDYASSTAQPDPEVEQIISDARIAAGISPGQLDNNQIQRQLLAIIVNEAACLLEDGIAMRASDMDVAFTNGYGFPRWRGGPVFWASCQDRSRFDEDLANLATAMGTGFRVGNVDWLLDELANGEGD